MKRRDFIQAGGAMGVAGLVAAAGPSFALKSPVVAEMERRLKFLSPPQGTPPDLLSQPSPPVEPFHSYSLSEFRPPVAKPLFSMTGPVQTGDSDGFLSPGPSFHARYGAPILTRRLNDLPEIGHTARRRHLLHTLRLTVHTTAVIPAGMPESSVKDGETEEQSDANSKGNPFSGRGNVLGRLRGVAQQAL